MTTAAFIVRLLRVRPGLFALTLLCAAATFGVPLLVGLVLRAFFDTLTGDAPAGLTIEAVLALFVAVELGGHLAGTGLSFTWGSLLFGGTAVLRYNLLRALFDGPGARALVEAPGATLSRFRDDADEIVESIDAWMGRA